jgi:hypothetical protein
MSLSYQEYLKLLSAIESSIDIERSNRLGADASNTKLDDLKRARVILMARCGEHEARRIAGVHGVFTDDAPVAASVKVVPSVSKRK